MTGTRKEVGGLTYLWPFESWGCAVDEERGFCKRQLKPPIVERLPCPAGSCLSLLHLQLVMPRLPLALVSSLVLR